MDEVRHSAPREAARSFVMSHFPEARASFLGGSVLTEHRTATSDLDIVVVLAGPPAPFRETFEHDGWVVEAFAHTRDSLDLFWDKDLARRRCSLARMCGGGEIVTDPAGVADQIQSEARRRIAAGPGPLGSEELDAMRYALTDVLDDLIGCQSTDELPFIAAVLLQGGAELALASAGGWLGIGKGLARELRAIDRKLADRIVAAHRSAVADSDIGPLSEVIGEVLDRAGGPFLVGYRAAGEPDAQEASAAP